MIRLLPEIESMLLRLLGLHDHARKVFDVRRIRSLSAQLHRLTHEFIHTKSGKDKYSDAYLAYHFPINLMKSWMITRWLQNRFPLCFTGKKTLHVLDIGCGHGAGMFGTYYALKKNHRISLTGIDRSAVVLKACRQIAFLVKKDDSRLRVTLRRHQLDGALLLKTRRKFDVVILANALAEIEQDEVIPKKYIGQIFRYATDDGIVVIIEPASRILSRRLMRLRDSLLQEHTYHILLPCLHERTCPLAAVRKGKEWCHQSRVWQPPHYIQMLNKTLHREIDRLKFSYLVLSKRKYRERSRSDFLVVSNLLKEKGRKRCYLCTPTGRVELVRLDTSRNLQNDDFDRIARGDIITLDDVKRKRQDTWRIEPSSRVSLKPSMPW
ncbi:MAG: methyltransferase domain-containing protein [candidate division WOR-3 bacterium]|nr:MAG: methyltransferase domain-containing protein [candidate division WOR-3 bacterium]